MDSNTEELKEIWKNSIPQDCWTSIQRISQLIDANSLDYCLKRWKDESDMLYNNSLNDISQSLTTSENPLINNTLENNILDNLIGPYRKTELMLALLCIKKRNLVEFRERIEKILQLARQDAENDKLNKNFIGSIANSIKNYVTTPGGQYTCEIDKDDKCFEKGIKQVISSLPEYPKCHPPTLMYIKHKPEEEFLNNNEKLNWKPKFAIPDEKTRINILEKKIPGITTISPTSNNPHIKKDEKPSFLRRKPSYSFLRNSSNRPTMRQSDINRPLSGGSLLGKKNNAPRRNMILDLEEVNRINQIQEEEKRLAQKREEEEKLAAEKEKERKKKEEMARKQKEKEERERERLEKRKKKQREVEEEKKRKEALKEAKEKEAKEKEKKRQEAIAAAKEAKEKEAREKELRKLKEKEAKEKEKQERLLQRENSAVKRRTRKKRRIDNESESESVDNSETATPSNKKFNDMLELSNDQNNIYPPEMNENTMNAYSNDYYNNDNNDNHNMNSNHNLHDPNMMPPNNDNDFEPNHNNYYDPNQNPYFDQSSPNEDHNMNNYPSNNNNNNNNNNYQPPPPNESYPPYQTDMDMNEYSMILGNTNLLNDEQRKFIIDFLNGKKVEHDAPTKIIPLNVETYEDQNLSIREIIEFEMNFQSGTWRKLKKTKKTLVNSKE